LNGANSLHNPMPPLETEKMSRRPSYRAGHVIRRSIAHGESQGVGGHCDPEAEQGIPLALHLRSYRYPRIYPNQREMVIEQ
jgi:hypothetical protein